MDSQKLAFLTALLNDSKGETKDTMLPFLMAAASKADKEGIHFSDEETDMLYQQMKKNLKPEDQMRMDMLYQMMKKKR